MNLQPLQIPAGWSVEWNLLTETDPTEATIHEFTGSSLLLLQSAARLKAIDVSWRPEGDLKGAYQLLVIPLLPRFNGKTNTMEYEGVWEAPEVEFTTKDRPELATKINQLLIALKPGTDHRILLAPGVVDAPHETLRQNLLAQGPTKGIVAQIVATNHKKLQDLLLDHKEVPKAVVATLAETGSSKGVRNKAKQMLKSRPL